MPKTQIHTSAHTQTHTETDKSSILAFNFSNTGTVMKKVIEKFSFPSEEKIKIKGDVKQALKVTCRNLKTSPEKI